MRNDECGIDPSLCVGWGCYAIMSNDGRPDRRMIKIGISSNVSKRLIALRTNNPYRVVVLRWVEAESKSAARQIEMDTHDHWLWKPFRVSGEWFDMPRGQIMFALEAIDAMADPLLGRSWPLPPGIRVVVEAGNRITQEVRA